MPYIEEKLRPIYDVHIDPILKMWKECPNKDAIAGDFTYVVYRLMKYFNGKFWHRAMAIGCLVCAILEMYRRDHAHYEDVKIMENGDVK